MLFRMETLLLTAALVAGGLCSSEVTGFAPRQAAAGEPVAAAPGEASAAGEPGTPLKPVNERFSGAESDEVPSFQRHIVPVLGRLGCNGRSCHGSFQGQGGFRLSLFGYDFKLDHDALLKGDAPRINREVPEDSLLLGKATLNTPHKGGRRMEVGGWEYQMFVRWIERGAPGAEEKEQVRFNFLEVTPAQIQFGQAGATTQLRAIAHWDDGIQEDVTPLCRFRTNDESISEVSDDGLVTSLKPGDTHVVVFYDNGVAPVQTILPVSDQVGPRYPEVPTPTQVDVLVIDKLRKLGVVPSELSADAEFLRRVSLDMTGTLPTPAEIEEFLASTAPDKRAKKIDELLERPAYAAWWATRMCDITGNNPRSFDEQGVQNQMARQWYEWIERRLRDNMPYDQLVSGIFVSNSREPGQTYEQYVSQMGSYFRKEDPADFAARETMPHYWGRRTFRTPEDRAMGFAYAFLGVRLQCAQCHKHPYDQWTQDDFNQFKTFFTRITYGVNSDAQQLNKELQAVLKKDKKKGQSLIENGEAYPWKELFVAAQGGKNQPKAEQRKQKKREPQVPVSITARLLGGDTIAFSRQDDPRSVILGWLQDDSNPYFARAFVNRIWAAYFGVGIIEPADDLSLANPPSNAPLLDHLASQFVAHKYDIKWLHREIANSRTYQLSWKPNETNRLDTRNFSHAVPRRLPAEVAADAIAQATATQDEMAARTKDPGRRSIAQGNLTGRANRNSNFVLTVFGSPARLTNCDCERSNEPSLLQTIYLQNDQEMLANLDRGGWLQNDQEMLANLDRGGWLQQVSRQLNPKTSETRKPQKEEVKLVAAIQKAEQQLKQQRRKLQKDSKPDSATQKMVSKLEKELKSLQDQQSAAVEAEAAAAASIAAATPPVGGHDQMVREAYLRTLSRPPTETEVTRGLQYIAESKEPVAGLRDLLWALLNTKEFIVNH